MRVPFTSAQRLLKSPASEAASAASETSAMFCDPRSIAAAKIGDAIVMPAATTSAEAAIRIADPNSVRLNSRRSVRVSVDAAFATDVAVGDARNSRAKFMGNLLRTSTEEVQCGLCSPLHSHQLIHGHRHVIKVRHDPYRPEHDETHDDNAEAKREHIVGVVGCRGDVQEEHQVDTHLRYA